MASGSKKHKKPSDNPNATTTQDSKAKRLGACTKCKAAKSHCELDDGTSACIRCVKMGLTGRVHTSRKFYSFCVEHQPSTWNHRSPGPHITICPQEKRAASATPTSQKPLSCKCSRSDADITQAVTQSQAKQRHHSTSWEPTPVAQTRTLESGGPALYSIAKVDDGDVLIESDSNTPPEGFTFTDFQEGAKEFLSALGEGAMLSDPRGKSEDYGPELDAVSSTTNDLSSESSGTDNAFLQSSLPPPPAVVKKQTKSTSTRRGGTSTTKAHMAQSTYDPQTCRKPNGTNSPFEIPSQITYDKLCMTVAKKLKCFPGTLRLQYRLDSNNTKHAATSIQSEQELVLFVARMRQMLVPQRLANGKPSTCPLKNVLVSFEDGGSDDKSVADPPNARSSKSGKGNQMGTKALTSGSKLAPLLSGTNAAEDGTTPHQENVERLQKRYTCKVHTKTSDAPVFCYPGPHETCLVLMHGQISYWAREIISGIGTVDNKSPTLYLHAMRPRTRTEPFAVAGSDLSHLPLHPFNPPGGYPYPPAPPVIVVPPWGGSLPGPGYLPHGAHGYLHPPIAPSQPANMQHGPDSSCSTSPTFSNVTDATSRFSINDVPLARIPSISAWLNSLDDHEELGKDNIGFTQFAPIFKQEGFLRLSQLSGEFMSWNELQGMLNVPCEIALLIIQYTKQDLRKLALEVLRGASAS